jgi:hypothetical protein
VTPLHLDMTHDETRRAMLGWNIPGRRIDGPRT